MGRRAWLLLLLVPSVAGVSVTLPDAVSEVSLYVIDGDGQANTGPAYMSAVVPPWDGAAWGDSVGGSCLAGPASGQWSWQVPLSVDAWPLAASGNYNHLHGRVAAYDATIVGTPRVDWSYRLQQMPPHPVYFEARVVGMRFDPQVGQYGDWVVGNVIASGRSGTSTATLQGTAAWELALEDPVLRAGTALELHVMMRQDDPLCDITGLPDPPVAAQMWATETVRPALRIATKDPIRVDRVDGTADGARIKVHAAFGQGQFDVVGGSEVLVGGVPAAGTWHFDPPVHEDFHPKFNGNRTWVFDEPPTGDVRFVFRTVDGVEAVIEWPAAELRSSVACRGTQLTCEVREGAPQSQTTPAPGYLLFVALWWVARRRA